jgi:alpha-L-fucosidase
MLKMMRTLNPDLILNHRFSWRTMRLGDFDGPENNIGRFQINRPWETCYCIGGGWGFSKKAKPLSKRNAIGLLVRCAGNGGNLLLNTGPSPEGTINPEHIERYLDMGRWLKKYGESVYATRGGPYKPGPWGCATRSKENNFIYLHILGDWNGRLELPAPGAKVVKAENITGKGKVKASNANGILVVEIKDFDQEQESDVDTIIKLSLDSKACKLPITKSVSTSYTVGAAVTASSSGSCGHKQTSPEAVIATTAKEVHDGAYVRSVWRAEGKDKKPWIEIDFGQPRVVTQIAIQEGRYGSSGTIKKFTISLREDGKWHEIYTGTQIGASFGLVLDKPQKGNAMRLDFKEFKGNLTINAINAYGAPRGK